MLERFQAEIDPLVEMLKYLLKQLMEAEVNKGLVEMFSNFRNRELDDEYPIIYVTELYEKSREGKRVVSLKP